MLLKSIHRDLFVVVVVFAYLLHCMFYIINKFYILDKDNPNKFEMQFLFIKGGKKVTDIYQS